MQDNEKSRYSFFPMGLQLFDLFYALAGTLYTCPASVALSTARMTHAYICVKDCKLSVDYIFMTGLQAAFESEGLDLRSTREAIERKEGKSPFHDAARNLFKYLTRP